MDDMPVQPLPDWVPDCARRYLAHTEAGRSIRQIARLHGCHASTVLRQIRQLEARREDPLVDAALHALATAQFPAARRKALAQSRVPGARKEDQVTIQQVQDMSAAAVAHDFDRDSARVLRRLSETGAVLAIAAEMEKAVVVRDTADKSTARTAVVDRTLAEALALKDWISCDAPGRISRYKITSTGRAALNRMLADQENRAATKVEAGFAEAQDPFQSQRRKMSDKDVADDEDGRVHRLRYNVTESPLTALARRRDRDGKPFLDDGLVRAGERLREDFELAQMGPNVTQNWDSFLTGGARETGGGATPGFGPQAARDRVIRALTELGPGLADVALRCCCFLEGLETAEKCMGWSARSGKIVLRIALQRLKRHYADPSQRADQLIG